MLSLAWPLVLAQAAAAAPGLVDTAVMGRLGTAAELAAVGVATVSYAFVAWAFGFLRMSTTGLTAQAAGAGDAAELRATLQRGLALAGLLGMGLLLAWPLARGLVPLAFEAGAEVERGALAYLDARVWGAPASLAGYVVGGWLLGRGRTRALLAWQLALNLGNAALDALLVARFVPGPAGPGAGTALAEWLALGPGLWLVAEGLAPAPGLWRMERLRALAGVQADLFVRTLALLSGFAWFTNAGARLGDAEAAANQALLQAISLSAFVLDAFAFVAEKEVGEAVGARDPARLWRAARLTSELALIAGLGFSLAVWCLGPTALGALVADPAARAAALAMLPFCAAVPLLGVPAWQLDGILLGATRSASLRRAALASTAAYLALDLALRPGGHAGAWVAFLAYYALRAASLLPGWRALRRDALATGRSGA